MSKILIVEDEKDIRELVGFTLKISGYDLVFAANGEEGYQLAAKEVPDLILMDYRMPVMNGDIAAEMIHAVPALAHIPVIFLTAKEQDPAIAGQIANGAHFIAKPFSIELLTCKVKEVLELSAEKQPS